MKAISLLGFTVTWIVLLALTATSWALSYVHLGAAGTPVAIVIAVVKASLVAVIFMELLEPRFSLRLVIATGIGMLVLLTALSSVDMLARPTPPMLPPDVH